MTPEQRRARGIAAEALTRDETLMEGWRLIEQDLIEELTKAAPWNDERAMAHRHNTWVEIQMLRNLRQKLANFAGQAPRD